MKGNEKTILIVDDDIDFQFMMTSMLSSFGFAVTSLIEGQLSQIVESAKVCDIILLDIELPGVSGVDIARELKSSPHTAGIPIILVSGHHECERLFLESQANALFRKPFSLRQLLNKVYGLLDLDGSASNSNGNAPLPFNQRAIADSTRTSDDFNRPR